MVEMVVGSDLGFLTIVTSVYRCWCWSAWRLYRRLGIHRRLLVPWEGGREGGWRLRISCCFRFHVLIFFFNESRFYFDLLSQFCVA